MTGPTDNPPPHYDIDPKTGERTWSGSSRSEVRYHEARAEVMKRALLAIVALSTQGNVCSIAAEALEKAR